MLIHDMTNKECVDELARLTFGRLACARDNQPYIVPIYHTYQHGYLYAFSMPGQKIEWMRANARVCVEVDEFISPFRWVSVVVVGLYEELPDTPEFKAERNLAYELLQQHAMWWEAACDAPHDDAAFGLAPVYYRIRIEQMTGHHAMADSPESATLLVPKSANKTDGWLLSLLRRARII